MGDGGKKDFTVEYTNLDIFNKIVGLEQQLAAMCSEYESMKAELAKYNGLRGRVSAVEKDIATIQDEAAGRNSVAEGIIRWGGWLVAMAVAYQKYFGG